VSVRAKFIVQSITKTAWDGDTVKMLSVDDPSIPESQRLALKSPTASIVLFTDTASAEKLFQLGQAYYVDFRTLEETQAQHSRESDPK
jgi:hypothetical protein